MAATITRRQVLDAMRASEHNVEGTEAADVILGLVGMRAAAAAADVVNELVAAGAAS